jgi:hypothetical protein
MESQKFQKCRKYILTFKYKMQQIFHYSRTLTSTDICHLQNYKMLFLNEISGLK